MTLTLSLWPPRLTVQTDPPPSALDIALALEGLGFNTPEPGYFDTTQESDQ